MFLVLLPARESFIVMLILLNLRYANFYIAFVLIWALLKAPFTAYGRAKSWKRILFDRLVGLILRGTNRKQGQAIFGPTQATYYSFTYEAKLRPLVEIVGDDAALLLWIGPRVMDNVLLYIHGVSVVLDGFNSNLY